MRQMLAEKLGETCVQCGTKENLEYNHKDVSLKKTRNSVLSQSVEKLNEESNNLEMLCSSCHRKHSTAQKAAAWHLFKSLSYEEQVALTTKFVL